MIRQDPRALQPFRTFTETWTAFHLNWDPSYKQMSIDKAAKKYGLPDLHPALVDFIRRYKSSNPAPYLIGSQHSTAACSEIGSLKIQIWSSIRLQSKSFHNTDVVMPPKLVNACLPCEDWPLGHYDSVIINSNRSKSWPHSGLAGERDSACFDK